MNLAPGPLCPLSLRGGSRGSASVRALPMETTFRPALRALPACSPLQEAASQGQCARDPVCPSSRACGKCVHVCVGGRVALNGCRNASVSQTPTLSLSKINFQAAVHSRGNSGAGLGLLSTYFLVSAQFCFSGCPSHQGSFSTPTPNSLLPVSLHALKAPD